jgi:hypothetical protein
MALWKFENSEWYQDDRTGAFSLKNFENQNFGDEINAPLELLIGAKLHPSVPGCNGTVFPSEFNHCPECGSTLEVVTNKRIDSWYPPYGSGDSEKVYHKHLKPETLVNAIGEPLPLPSSVGHFSFISAYFGAKNRLLLALQRDVGQLWVYRPNAKNKWFALEGLIGDCSMPNWAWSLALDVHESACAFPTDKGVAWVTVDWTTNRLNVDLTKGEVIGGPARVGKFILVPIIQDNQLYLLSRAEGDSAWTQCSTSSDPSCIHAQLQRNPDQLRYCGVPLVDKARMIGYWPCRGGYIKVAGFNSSNPGHWEFRQWENDAYPATALIELGVPYRKTGSRPGFWQLCWDYDPGSRDGRVNKIIKYDGDISADSEIVENGEFLTTGRSSFSWHYDFWDDVHRRSPGSEEHIELRLPLLQFGEKGLCLIVKVRPWHGREDLGLFSELFYSRENEVTTFVRLAIQGAGIPEEALVAEGVDGADGFKGSFFRVTAAHAADIAAFIYDDRLYVYFPEENKCYGWPVEMVSE